MENQAFTEWYEKLKNKIKDRKNLVIEGAKPNIIQLFLFRYCGGEKRITKKALKYVEENKDKLRDMYYNSKLKSLLDNDVKLE